MAQIVTQKMVDEGLRCEACGMPFKLGEPKLAEGLMHGSPYLCIRRMAEALKFIY